MERRERRERMERRERRGDRARGVRRKTCSECELSIPGL